MEFGKGKPGVRSSTLQLAKEEGGMAVPNLKDYFYSVQIRPLMNPCNQDYKTRWKDIELSLSEDSPIQAILGNRDLGNLLTV